MELPIRREEKKLRKGRTFQNSDALSQQYIKEQKSSQFDEEP
jgi:hypothetical protein